jgi:sugar phosphate permease
VVSEDMVDGDGKFARPWIVCCRVNNLHRIFIIEGCVTVVMSIIMYWWLADWPADCRFLTPDEHKVLMWRLMDDSEGDAKMDRVNWSRCARDWKVWVA